MTALTREWVSKAEGDDRAVAKLRVGTPPSHDEVCFHCQQSAEKYFKALLQETGSAIPYTHDLETLQSLLTAYHPSLRSLRRGLKFLSRFGVAIRYPGRKPHKRQADAATRWAERVRRECRALLGLSP